MSGDGRWVPRLAVVSPLAAEWLLRRMAAGVRTTRQDAISWALSLGKPEVAREMGQAFDQLAAAAQDWRDHTSQVADTGNAAMPNRGPRPALSHLGGVGPAVLTASQVAERLGLKERQVRNLCGPDGPLSATKPGKQWLIDEESVRDLETLRSVADDQAS